MRVVLVTGGSGLVGRALQEHVNALPSSDEKWVFASSADADLTSFEEASKLFRQHRPSHVIHLAVKLTAGSDMPKIAADLLVDNVAIDTNTLRCAHEFGVRKVVSVLSSFAYPIDVMLPVTEAQLHAGPCHKMYESYGSAKRLLEILSRAYRTQYGKSFVTLIPSNIFGAVRELREDGPVVDAFISKAFHAKYKGEEFVIRGSGSPLRQFCYAPDLARVLVWALNNYDEAEPLNVTGQEISIGDVARAIATEFGIEEQIRFDGTWPDGPLRRTLSDAKLRESFCDYTGTNFGVAIRTVLSEWVKKAGK